MRGISWLAAEPVIFSRRTLLHGVSMGASVQSTTGSRGVRITGSTDGYTMFRGSVKSTGYPLNSPVSPSLPPPVRHHVPLHFSWVLPVLMLPVCWGGEY